MSSLLHVWKISFLFGTVGNSLTIAVICKSKSLKVVSNFILISLAFADLLVGAVLVPMRASQHMSSFKVYPKLPESRKATFLYGYGFLPTYPVKMITENGTFVKSSPEKRFFPMYVTTDENRTFRKRCLVSPNWDSNLTPKNHSAEQSPTLRVPMYNLCFCNLTL